MNTTQSLHVHLSSHPEKVVFTPAFFGGLAPQTVVHRFLARMTKKGHIERLGRGLYIKSRATSHLGIVITPSATEIAQTLAAQEGAVVSIHPAEAARMFGFSTQMQVRPVFITNGRSRRIHCGKLPITLRHVCSRKMMLAGTPAGWALAALWYLGPRETTARSFARIAQRLSPTDFAALGAALSLMPLWMRTAWREHQKNF